MSKSNAAKNTGFVADSIDRIQSAVESAQSELDKFQKDMEKRRKQFEKRAQKEMKRIQKDFQTSTPIKRATEIQKDVTSQIESSVDAVLGNLQIASRRDVAKIDKKLNKISRKLSALDKAMSPPSGTAAAAE